MATVTQGSKVGAFLLISAAGGFLVYNTVKKEVGRGTGYTVHAYLNDAAGLAPHSRVTIAGKGGHNNITGNTWICVERRRACVVLLANDVRAEAAFPGLVRFILGETGAPYDWSKNVP